MRSLIEQEYLDDLLAAKYPAESLDGMQLAAGPSKTRTDAPTGAGLPKAPTTPEQAAEMMRNMPLATQSEMIMRRIAEDQKAGVVGSVIPKDMTLREKLASGMQQMLIDNTGMDNVRARRLAQTMFGGESSGAPLGIGLVDVTPFVIPLAAQEAGISAGEAREAAQAGEYGKAALSYGTGVLQGLDVVPGVALAAKGGKAVGEALAPVAGEMVEGYMRKTGGLMDVAPPGPAASNAPALTRSERTVVTNAAGRKPTLRKTATKAVEDMHANYPEADGWVPIEASKIEFKQSKTGEAIAEVEAAKIPYDFHTPPEGVPKDLWQATLSSRLFDEVQEVVNRAQAGDQAAIDILSQASWYRSMRDRLRAEFGGTGDVFADVLGTTSAQTGVEQNFDNAIEILRRFSRGEYDAELRAYEDRLKAGLPVDAKTLTQLFKEGKFPLITKASGQLFNANSPSSMGALLDMFRAVKAGDSPKTPNFTGNLIGLTNEATIDVWAARMLRRLADLPRIPPPAEKGVAGKHLVGSTLYDPKVGSEFGFGQDVFREAAQEINNSGIIKGVAPQIGDLGPDDLQAVAWFIEKEKWTNNGWTSKAGEGGSLDFEMSLAGAADPQGVKDLRRDINTGFKPPAQRKTETDQQYAARVQEAKAAFDSQKPAKQQQLSGMKADVDRYTLGVSGERPNRPMSNYAQAELAAEFDDVVRADPSVVTYNLSNTYGSFMAQTERALNAEFVTRQNFNPASLERRLVEQGKAYDQDAVFISKVLRNGTAPNARPGVEIYFKQKVTPEQMEKVTAKLREYGVDGFTYVTDMRFNDRINVQAKAGGADTAGLNGLRFQYIPEFDDAYNGANRAQIMSEKQRLFDQVVTDIIGDGNVSDARLVWYDTNVFFRSDYDAYLGRNAEGARGAPGQGSPSGANASQPDRSGKIRQGVSGTVSDRRGRQAGILSGQEVTGGRQAPAKGAK